MIEISHLRKEYEDATPLKDVCATIEDGDVIAVIGPSGTGKSTLLRCINLLERPTSGRILIDGTDILAPDADVSALRQKVGMVFQSFNLFSHLTAIENVMLSPVTLRGRSRQEAYEQGMRLLRTVGLADKARSYPDELSGGQQQRIAIVRTLAMDPDVILLDEPTSALDPTMVAEVEAVIGELAATEKTLMIVTHEMRFAEAVSDRVFYMDEGTIYEQGPTQEILKHPSRERTRRFVRSLRVLEIAVDSRDYDFHATTRQIELYGIKNQVEPKMLMRMQLAFEELVQQALVPRMSSPDILVTIEYAARDRSATFTLRYGGAPLNVIEHAEELSQAVIRAASTEASWTWLEGQERPNQVSVCLRT